MRIEEDFDKNICFARGNTYKNRGQVEEVIVGVNSTQAGEIHDKCEEICTP